MLKSNHNDVITDIIDTVILCPHYSIDINTVFLENKRKACVEKIIKFQLHYLAIFLLCIIHPPTINLLFWVNVMLAIKAILLSSLDFILYKDLSKISPFLSLIFFLSPVSFQEHPHMHNLFHIKSLI